MKKLIKNEVAELLANYPALRDDDRALTVNVWGREMVRLGIDPTRFREFFNLYKKGVLTNAESIRRTRQMIQERNKAMRGSRYDYNRADQDNWKKEVCEN